MNLPINERSTPSVLAGKRAPGGLPGSLFGQTTLNPAVSSSTSSSFGFGEPRPTLPPLSPLPSTLHAAATSGATFGAFGAPLKSAVEPRPAPSPVSSPPQTIVGLFGENPGTSWLLSPFGASPASAFGTPLVVEPKPAPSPVASPPQKTIGLFGENPGTSWLSSPFGASPTSVPDLTPIAHPSRDLWVQSGGCQKLPLKPTAFGFPVSNSDKIENSSKTSPQHPSSALKPTDFGFRASSTMPIDLLLHCFGFPVSSSDKIENSSKTSPRVQSKGPFPTESETEPESQAPKVGIFGPAAPYLPSAEIATFLSGDAHRSAKETFDLKFKSIFDKLPSKYDPDPELEPLYGQSEDILLLKDLMQIEEILQTLTIGYTDTNLELVVGGSWLEGIYIANIQAKFAMIGKNWKANFDPLDTEHIEAVDGVPRSQEELKTLMDLIIG